GVGVVRPQPRGGGGLGEGGGGGRWGGPVARGPPAVPAAREDVHDVVPLLQRIEAAQGQVAAGAGGGGEEIVGNGARQRDEDALVDARADLGGAARDGPRVARVEERPVRVGDLERLEAAGV